MFSWSPPPGWRAAIHSESGSVSRRQWLRPTSRPSWGSVGHVGVPPRATEAAGVRPHDADEAERRGDQPEEVRSLVDDRLAGHGLDAARDGDRRQEDDREHPGADDEQQDVDRQRAAGSLDGGGDTGAEEFTQVLEVQDHQDGADAADEYRPDKREGDGLCGSVLGFAGLVGTRVLCDEDAPGDGEPEAQRDEKEDHREGEGDCSQRRLAGELPDPSKRSKR